MSGGTCSQGPYFRAAFPARSKKQAAGTVFSHRNGVGRPNCELVAYAVAAELEPPPHVVEEAILPMRMRWDPWDPRTEWPMRT